MRTPLRPTSVAEVVEIAENTGFPHHVLVQMTAMVHEKMFRAVGLTESGRPTEHSQALGAKIQAYHESIARVVSPVVIAWTAGERIDGSIPLPGLRYPHNTCADFVVATSLIGERVEETAGIDAAALSSSLWLTKEQGVRWRWLRRLYDCKVMSADQEKVFSGILDDAEDAFKENMFDPQNEFLVPHFDGMRSLHGLVDFLSMSPSQRNALPKK